MFITLLLFLIGLSLLWSFGLIGKTLVIFCIACAIYKVFE